MTAHLTIDNLAKRYASTTALDEVSFEVEPGELKVLLGPSGSGKSTVLKAVAGLISPTRGRVLVRGKDITDIPIHRRNIGLVMQGYSLFPHMTAYENVAFPLRTPMHRCGQRDLHERVVRMFELTGLAGLESQRPAELSGGQQQRVALARALVFSPEVLLLDEPLAALDRELRERMQEEIRRIHRTLGMTIIYVTHDQSEAMKVADRIVVLNRGRVAQEGSAVQLYESPIDEFVAHFLGGANFVTGTVTSIRNGHLNVEVGDVELRVPSVDGLRPETQVTLMVRPERVQVGVPDAGSNHLPGTVVDSTYLGSALQTIVSLSDGTVWKSNVTPARSRVQAGAPTHLHWRIEDTRVLAAQQTPTNTPLEASNEP
jgi:ABC-type Fe3+/spermidine/putrescine transport system ATPase subunit